MNITLRPEGGIVIELVSKREMADIYSALDAARSTDANSQSARELRWALIDVMANITSQQTAPSLDWVNPPDYAKRLVMKNYDSRTYSINDFIEWDRQKRLELNPIFQRRSIWSDKAKSYLIDTILRGKPIPKIFIRQKINVSTRVSIREVVDGQQRLRTILSFIKDGFVVSKLHNREFGGCHYSELPDEVQVQILAYELSVDLLINLPDAEILDIFGRLNSYAIVLNEEETTHNRPHENIVVG